MALRDYQRQGILDIVQAFKNGSQRVLFTLPTGGGKTVIIADIAASGAKYNKRCMILVHRQELIRQTSDKLRKVGQPHGIIWSNQPRTDHLIQVASVQTLRNRHDRYQAPDLIIIDEAHHAPASTYRTILDAYPFAKVLGVTATPERADGTGLDTVFDELVLGPTISQLTEAGYLCPAVVYRPPRGYSLQGLRKIAGDWETKGLAERASRPAVVGNLIDHYRRYAEGLKGICFAVNVDTARLLAKAFTVAGYPSASVDGSMSDGERQDTLKAFEKSEILLLMTCDLVSEGFDVPNAVVGILGRPTTSRGLHRQMIGRVLRPAEGKDSAIILDHAGNTFEHGLPDYEPDWTLLGTKGRRKSAGEALPPSRQCPECYRVFPPAPICPGCNYVFEAKGRQVEYVDGELQLATPSKHEIKKEKRMEQGKAKSLEELIELGKQRGYKHPTMWAHQVYQGRQREREHH